MSINDVLDFGAEGNGTPNDAPVFQKTIDTCTAS